MARDRKDIAARQLDQRGADAPVAGLAAVGVPSAAPHTPALADSPSAPHPCLVALVRLIARQAAAEEIARQRAAAGRD